MREIEERNYRVYVGEESADVRAVCSRAALVKVMQEYIYVPTPELGAQVIIKVERIK